MSQPSPGMTRGSRREEPWAEMLPYVIESLGVILSAWFSFSIAHFGPKVEPQLAWAITASLASLYQPNMVEAVGLRGHRGVLRVPRRRHPQTLPAAPGVVV